MPIKHYLCTKVLKLSHKTERDMDNLNLPAFDMKLGGTASRPLIWDMLRCRYVALTPEEWVRQHFIHFLTERRHYPTALLANEVELRIGSKRLRADSVLYTRRLLPQMIVEYKAPHIEITQRVFEQIAAYNMKLHVDYLVISNGMRHFCGRTNYEDNTLTLLPDIPFYADL